ncbi:putative xanthine dehydrogenase subunit E [Caprobacter fermentans]|uniref:Putative xanthine dehydrogenase subunit E n=2 Tax=Caproicibacter fermentans TaxID=2576756 RepID=A0A6N8I2E9_9FIRM|nr:putative xanthine dehydrogenase subunit E [Caproicibacter fermentans]
MKVESITLYVNGTEYRFSVGTMFGQLPPSETLSETLRNRLGLTGSKQACGEGACGCCTVIVDGDAITSCITLTIDCDGKHIPRLKDCRTP